MATKIKKKITLDDLAVLAQKGFLELGDKVDRRIDNLEEKISNLENGQKEIKLRLD